MADSPDVATLGELNGDAAADKPVATSPDIASLDELNAIGSDVAKPASKTKPVHKVATSGAPQTHFQQSVSASDDPELSWGDVGKQALGNALPSIGGVGKSMFEAVRHPIKTAQAIGDIGKGAVSQAAGALGVQQDPAEKAQNETLISALENHYKTVYGSVKGFKKALATDPAGVGMDVSSVIPGFGAAADAAGLAKTAGVIGKIGSAVDPVANAVRVAKIPAKIIAPVARQASSLLTGVPASALKLATEVGAHPNPAVRTAYTKFVTGQGDATEFQRAAQGAVNSIKNDMSADYLAKKGPMANTPVDLSNTQAALADAAKKAQMGSTVGPVRDAAMKAIGDAKAMADDVANTPGRNTLENVDALKQQMWNLKDFHKDLADNYLNGIYHGVKADLVGADPEYAELMGKYQDAMQNVNDITKTLGAGKNTAASAMLVKNLRAMKTGTGENLLAQIMAKDPTIGGMLAGQALHPWHAGGRSTFEALLAAPTASAIFGHPMAAAAAVPLSLAGSSPRLAGAIAHGAGSIGRLADTGAVAPKAAYYAGRAEQEGDEPSDSVVGETSPEVDQTWQRILKQESGAKQFRPDGSPVTSKKGAIGIAQVMPKTGPTAAALAGESWSLPRLKTDAAYNEKLGKAYFTSLVQQYGGDVEKAAAAYNGGPHNVDRALNLSQSSGKPWLSHMVSETRDYVPNVTGDRVGRKSGGRTRMTHEQLVERLMKLARAAKKGEDASTEPLLKVPDAVVVKALDVAQRAI